MPLLEPPRDRVRLSAVSCVVVAILLVWSPLSLAIVTAAAWPRLMRYGWPAWLVVTARIVVVCAGLVAARWILDRDPRGPRLAAQTFLGAAAVAIVLFLTPYFPSNAVPSTKAAWLSGVVVVNLTLAWAMRRQTTPSG